MTTEPLTSPAATAFADDFATATREDWLKAAEAALKGRPLEPVIRRRTMDGVTVNALLERVTPRVVAGRPAGGRWTAMTVIDIADPEAANAQALEDLNNGASGLSLKLAGPGETHGLVADTLDRLDRALDGVLLDLAPLHLELPAFHGRATAALVTALVERRKLDPASVFVLFGADLLRDLARTGALPRSWEAMCARLAGAIAGMRRRGFTSPVLSVDARQHHGAGATDAQELGAALGSATQQVRGLVAAGLPLETAADAVSFAFACDAEQFTTIAKLRAARLLWAAWRREAGLPEAPVHIHAETSRRMLTRRDAHTNMVRSTIAAFAAGVGGADSIVVLPFTDALGGINADARRIARNAQAIILEETNAHRVADPAAGAGAIEAYTDDLAEAGWAAFREVEAEGGFLAALANGSWQDRLMESRAAREAAVAKRSVPIVGVSEFPQADEAPIALDPRPAVEASPSRRPLAGPVGEDEAGYDALVAAALDGASLADLAAATATAPTLTVRPCDTERLAAGFERLRAENEAATPRPGVFLALLGPIARHSARAGFIRNLTVAGGLKPVDGPILGSADDVAEAFAQSGLKLAVLCGSDDGYAEEGAALAKALAARGAAVWLAGRPKEGREALEAAGVARFVAAGDDMLTTLKEASAASAGGAR
ncbi:methylmalonyl-CoA mutase [Methylopila jiangsuensis]|uniref:Methylmalonyl-CoA mutase n=1 Tax=Methylopila jiangsuensis TaxID=586230 RepID=A0A9W6JHM6_9HYPH|nr:methylmalonyl-CoA mutase family protein [Methylopila jiangsuensis]MDR6286450.1 methylmalonyl-CoA mutase [Methylopila jiangsuensis]GLK77212.1 methylmalonyl-CoA mutase [Methylopila jiangsuensis]